MTLLAFKVEAPHAVTASDLVAVVRQLLAFLLSFTVVANFWWHWCWRGWRASLQ